jgi:hypothetical protein
VKEHPVKEKSSAISATAVSGRAICVSAKYSGPGPSNERGRGATAGSEEAVHAVGLVSVCVMNSEPQNHNLLATRTIQNFHW